MTNFSIEGDGICTHLYELLRSEDDNKSIPKIKIPHTVVYRYGRPVQWYFTSKDGTVKKKFRQNITNCKIFKAFVERPSRVKCEGFDVVAYFIGWESDDCEFRCAADVEYFEPAHLEDFLFKRIKQGNGILQSFIMPKGERNSAIRIVWTPTISICDRRVNRRILNDKRFGIYERIITFDGPDLFSMKLPLCGSPIASAAKQLSENIAGHVNKLCVKDHISSMSINLKLDHKDRLCFLWSTSIRISGDCRKHSESNGSLLSLDEIVRVPKHIKLHWQNPNHDRSYSSVIKCDQICASCGKFSNSHDFYSVTFKTIVIHFEQVINLVSVIDRTLAENKPTVAELISVMGGIGFGELLQYETLEQFIKKQKIPPVILALHPNLAFDSYVRYRNDPLFIFKTAEVCECCYLKYAKLASLTFHTGPTKNLASHILSLTSLPLLLKNLEMMSIYKPNECRNTKDVKSVKSHRHPSKKGLTNVSASFKNRSFCSMSSAPELPSLLRSAPDITRKSARMLDDIFQDAKLTSLSSFTESTITPNLICELEKINKEEKSCKIKFLNSKKSPYEESQFFFPSLCFKDSGCREKKRTLSHSKSLTISKLAIQHGNFLNKAFEETRDFIEEISNDSTVCFGSKEICIGNNLDL